MSTRLFDLLVADVPSGFAISLVERVPLIYAEASESVNNDPRFGDPEARYLHGHVRRALVEKYLRDLGTEQRMRVEMRRADGVGGPEHVMLSTGRFRFTACHIPPLRDFPQESRYREQYSLINEHASQVQLFPVDSRPGEHTIYGIIFHREAAGNKAKLGTLCIGFPNVECDGWIEEPIDVVDLVDAQKPAAAPMDESGGAVPKWKNKKDKKKDTEQ